MDNDKIIKISLEFVEMVFKMMESKRTKKTFWVSKTSDKIHKLMEKEKADFKKEIKEKIEGMKKKNKYGNILGFYLYSRFRQGYNEAINDILDL